MALLLSETHAPRSDLPIREIIKRMRMRHAGKRGVGRRISGTLACTGITTDERAQRVLIELATEYEAIAEAAPRRRRVKHFSPPRLSGCDYLKHGAPSARGHVVKGHVARPARNPAVDRTTASDAAPACAGQVAGTCPPFQKLAGTVISSPVTATIP
jgi:hypothetical protein